MKDANANVAVIDPDGHLRWRNSGRLSEEDQKSLLSSVQSSLPQEGAANPGTN
jgi:predicted transcriptional regulator